MSLFRLNREAFPSIYYAAGVFSMLDSAHNFFFLSLDPQGFVSIDKPPLGFWVQTLFAKALGFHPLVVVLPQVLAGVAAAGLLFHLVRRVYGLPAGFLAGIVLALAPVSVATSRTNLVDPQLVLTSLLAAWAALVATETENPRRRLGLFLIAAFAIGAGFNIKSSQALLPVPAIFLVYLVAAPEAWRRKLATWALAGAIVIGVGLAWPLVYDAVGEDQRPWVGSTETNRQRELIFGYNTAKRFQTEPSQGSVTTQAPGFDWIWEREYGAQIGWLIPFAALGTVAAWRGRPQIPLDRRQANLLLWSAWAVPQIIFFALAEFTHSYYLVMLAPAVAALTGIGGIALGGRYRSGGWWAWLAPVAIVLTLLVQFVLLGHFPGWRTQLLPLMLILCVPAAVILVVLRLRGAMRSDLAVVAGGVALVGLLVAPTVWAGMPVWRSAATAFPAAGPSNELHVDRDADALSDPAAAAYLSAHRQGERWAVAARVADDAAEAIVTTELPAMAVGGFIGNDPILTVDQFVEKVAAGEVRYVVINPRRDLPAVNERVAQGPSRPVDIMVWASEHCALVPWEEWRSTPALPADQEKGWSRRLYDCADAAP